MAVPSKVVLGRIIVVDERALLLLDQTQKLYLRFALTELNSGEHVFPESVLDDWGKEIKNLSMYRWMGDNGIQFPRAELFGYYLDDIPVQRFLRELDLTRYYVCYVYTSKSQPLKTGIVVSDVVESVGGVREPKSMSAPEHMGYPMIEAELRWWSADFKVESQMAAIINYSPGKEIN